MFGSTLAMKIYIAIYILYFFLIYPYSFDILSKGNQFLLLSSKRNGRPIQPTRMIDIGLH